jgi:guanylate kinase
MSGLPPVIIVSGPSGSGKSTVLARLLAGGDLPLRLAVSATTRPPRPGERDGVHYHFWTPEQFEEAQRRGEFLEWAEVHGHTYGTLRREVEPYRRKGMLVLLEIDVQGAAQVRRLCPETVAVFVRTSSLETYEARLRQRGTEDETTLQRRLRAAERELASAPEYDYQVINDNLDTAVAELRNILRGQLEGDTHAG